MSENVKVRGYMKPTASFRTLHEWEHMAEEMLKYQEVGYDTRGGKINCISKSVCTIPEFDAFSSLINEYFNYQLTTEVDRWDLLTRKNILDFIEDFINHRLWAFDKEFGHYFPDISKLRFAYFYSRGDIEPYVLLDEEYTTQIYGSIYNPKMLCHYTTEDGVRRIANAINSGKTFDISSFTIMERPFFREESNVLLKFIGNVRAGFRSDIKSMATDSGTRSCNMYRLDYPDKDQNNICYELDSCDGDVKTSLWNEYIATPMQMIEIVRR
jgi:hypothetical protein